MSLAEQICTSLAMSLTCLMPLKSPCTDRWQALFANEAAELAEGNADLVWPLQLTCPYLQAISCLSTCCCDYAINCPVCSMPLSVLRRQCLLQRRTRSGSATIHLEAEQPEEPHLCETSVRSVLLCIGAGCCCIGCCSCIIGLRFVDGASGVMENGLLASFFNVLGIAQAWGHLHEVHYLAILCVPMSSRHARFATVIPSCVCVMLYLMHALHMSGMQSSASLTGTYASPRLAIGGIHHSSRCCRA